jgi:hypothetical protein
MWRMRYSGRCSVPLARTATGYRQPDRQTVRFNARIIKHDASRIARYRDFIKYRIARRQQTSTHQHRISIAASAS